MLENSFKPRPRVEMLIKWLMFTACIIGMALFAAFYPVEGNIPFIVIPSLLTLLFAKPVFFEKLKLTTLVVVRIIIIFAAFSLFDRQIYIDIILIALIVNILEATLTDLLKHKKYFNAVSGFLLAISVCCLKGNWLPNGGEHQMAYYLVYGSTQTVTICWVIAYTIWNWIFVTDEFSPSVSLMHVGFLGAPILACVLTMGMNRVTGLGTFDPMGLWLLMRANTLAIGGWMQICAKNWFETHFYNEKFAKFVNWTHKTVPQIIFMLINIGLLLFCMIVSFPYAGFLAI